MGECGRTRQAPQGSAPIWSITNVIRVAPAAIASMAQRGRTIERSREAF